MQHAFVHLELNTDDVEQARNFYRSVFGWDFNDVPVGRHKYVQIETAKPPGGGIQFKAAAAMPSHWMPYVGVSDVRAVVRKARKAGAKVVADYNAIPGYGALAILTDPSGACFGVWEAAGAVVGDDEAPEVAPTDTSPQDVPAKAGGRTRSTKKAAKKKAAKKKTTKKKAASEKSSEKKAAKKATKKKAASKKSTKKKAASKKSTKKKAASKKSTKKKAASKKKAGKRSSKKRSSRTGRRGRR